MAVLAAATDSEDCTDRPLGLGPTRSALARLRSTDAVVEDGDRIARDLHDAVVQRLFAAGLTLHGALRFIDANPEATDRVELAIDELDRVVQEVRCTVLELQHRGRAGRGNPAHLPSTTT